MKIRTRLFLVFAIMMATGIYSLVHWMQGEMKPRYMEAQEDTLVDFVQFLSTLITEHGIEIDQASESVQINPAFLQQSFRQLLQRQFSAHIYEIHKSHVDIRVYITDKTGKVVFDSDNDRDLHADYSQWRDVHRTLKGEYGARSSENDPLYPEGSIMYIAAPVMYQNDIIGVVSVGKPTRNAERFMGHLLDNISTVGLIIVVIALIIGLIIHGWLTLPLERLQQYASAVIKGERPQLPQLGNNEVGRVGHAMQAMREALDGKSYVSDYVQSLTHELKSPLASIRGASELLSEDMPGEDRDRFLKNIHNETQRMQDLIDRLLELASLEYRPSLEKYEDLNLQQLMNDVIESLLPYARTNHVELSCHIEPQLKVRGESFLLSQVFLNIIKNAIEHSPADSKVSIVSEVSENTRIVTICDNGSGIPDYAKQKVFDRFYSLPRPNGKKGSGLGLSFVREIAALHEIDVQIFNNPNGSGTCVRLVFHA